jgi:hypothetical protein
MAENVRNVDKLQLDVSEMMLRSFKNIKAPGVSDINTELM